MFLNKKRQFKKPAFELYGYLLEPNCPIISRNFKKFKIYNYNFSLTLVIKLQTKKTQLIIYHGSAYTFDMTVYFEYSLSCCFFPLLAE